MVTMGVKMLWTLALFVFSCTSQSQGEFTEEKITYLSLRDGQRSWSTYIGRVVIQINHEGVDGAICGTWTREDAIVACRMLGYSDGNNIPWSPVFLPGNHNFLMSNLRCTGQETSISDCHRDPIVNCTYNTHDVIASCTNPLNPVETYTNGVAVQTNRVTIAPVSLSSRKDYAEYTQCQPPNPNIRLHGVRERPGMGYVQVNVNGVWQYICDDKWSENDAKVVCRELCYTEQTGARPGIENEYSPLLDDTPTFAWNRVQCTGAEKTLNNCFKNYNTPQGQCGQHELAGVQCVVPPENSAAMEAQLECSNLNGDIVVHFTHDNFPTINDDSIRIANTPAGCTTRAQRVQSTGPDNGNYNMRIPTQGCGTTKTDNATHICYSNTVEYDNEVYRGNVLIDYEKKTFSVQCCMPTDKDLSIHFIPRAQENALNIGHNFDYTPEISFYQNERYDAKITDNPYAVEVGDWVYIVISVQAEDQSPFRDSDLKLVVTRCTANPIRAGMDGINPLENVTLIDNTCPADIASVTTYPISNTTEGFRFRAFKFFGYSSVYVTCHLRVCLSTHPKPQCDSFSVSSCLPTEKDVSIKFIPKTQEYAQSISHNFDYAPEISFYQNERYDVKITDNPYAVEVGDWVYIGVSVKAENQSLFRDSDLKLVVTRCTANPIRAGMDGINSPEFVTLIDDKCPSDLSSVTTYPISNTIEGFRFRAFKFFGYSSVYVTCHPRICLSTDPKPQCDRSCFKDNIIGRKRRNFADEVTGLDTVVSQILQITDPNQPPVYALPAQSHEDRTVESTNPRFLKP